VAFARAQPVGANTKYLGELVVVLAALGAVAAFDTGDKALAAPDQVRDGRRSDIGLVASPEKPVGEIAL